MHPQLKLLVVGSALVSGLVVVIFSFSCDQEIQSRVEYRPDQGGVRAKAERSRSNTDGSASSATSRRLAGAPVTPLVIEESLKQWLPDANNTLPNFYTRSVRKPAYDRRYRDGILVFLHHNKAAGTSTKACLEDLVHDRSLTGSLAVLNKSGRLEVEKAIGQGDQFSTLMGGYAFGICDKVPNQMCSYFTMLRDPYERVISSYNYCKRRHNDDQTCRGLLAEDVTLKEWALHQGTYFFWQLLIKPWFCVTGKALAVNPAFADFTDTPHTPGTTFNNTPCWFREKVILKRSLSREQMDVLLAYCVSHLEDWFSVIGLSTEYDLTLAMLEDIYQMPFRKKCLHIHGHRKKVDTSDMKRELEEDPDVYEALRGDLIIYEKAKEIFERQKEAYLKKKTPRKTTN